MESVRRERTEEKRRGFVGALSVEQTHGRRRERQHAHGPCPPLVLSFWEETRIECRRNESSFLPRPSPERSASSWERSGGETAPGVGEAQSRGRCRHGGGWNHSQRYRKGRELRASPRLTLPARGLLPRANGAFPSYFRERRTIPHSLTVTLAPIPQIFKTPFIFRRVEEHINSSVTSTGLHMEGTLYAPGFEKVQSV